MTENNTPVNIPEIHPTEEIAERALQAVAELLHSNQITSKTFTRPLENGGGELAELVIGELSEGENPHVLLSTYGVGGVETTGEIKIPVLNDKSFPYHSEFYMVANSIKNANLFAEQLVNLSFVTSTQKSPFMPGMILQTPDPNVSFFFSEKPLGVLSEHGHNPVFVEDFALCFVCVTPIYGDEQKMFTVEEELQKFNTWFTSLGSDAYKPDRPRYKADEELVKATEPDTTE